MGTDLTFDFLHEVAGLETRTHIFLEDMVLNLLKGKENSDSTNAVTQKNP